ncbi:Rid family detoxifying hydrolase [Spiroplasma melliferum]|uniref:Endoribonuclease L-PSP n=2 Tax=Spiroplasma melliferum TaxID=2134 RepID=A0AAI9T2W0_SPIME|nr:Rid family detoxifying hydrolase [Spiroplasma melliferum]ELL44185.1 endoribonuclease L-PSP [Spiroplasma melliferum IPMB4A]KAI92315.1 endoribonuclease L-PSP [Spiroplasma melliferum KC3]QCO23749.1 TdcF protein [Spiroplasma melliferum]
MELIHTVQAPQAVGPYSQAIKLANGFLYISGQLGLNPTTMLLVDNISDQTRQVLANINAILTAAKYTKDNVIKTTILLSDINDFVVVNEIYESFFKEHKPARSTFAVKALPKAALIEIEVIAFKENS